MQGSVHAQDLLGCLQIQLSQLLQFAANRRQFRLTQEGRRDGQTILETLQHLSPVTMDAFEHEEGRDPLESCLDFEFDAGVGLMTRELIEMGEEDVLVVLGHAEASPGVEKTQLQIDIGPTSRLAAHLTILLLKHPATPIPNPTLIISHSITSEIDSNSNSSASLPL